VSNPVADFKRRAASMQEIAKALNLLRDNIARVKGVGLIVLLEFGDGVRHRVNCDAGVVDATQVDADCTIAIPAADFIQIVGGGIDPRFLICFQRMKMTGSPRAVTKFLDAIGARQS
jgi:SCP-2 sterol transfer family